jgi:hypothetical protein
VAISLVGTLPVSGLNLGLVASLGGLTAETAQLSARIADITPALSGQVTVSSGFPPNPVTHAPALSAALNPVTAAIARAALASQGAAISSELGVKLGGVQGRLTVISNLTATFGVGLNANGISGWCYSGSARGFGRGLEQQTVNGFGRTAPDTNVHALVIATESFGSWGSFGEGFRVGGTDQAPADPALDSLRYQGELGGGEWNTGTASLLARFRLLEAELEGNESALEASIDAFLGIGLPTVGDMTDVGLDIFADIGITGLLDNLVNVQSDLGAEIGGLNTQISFVTGLSGDISAQLAASGLSLWLYDGPAAALGAELLGEIEDGLPGGSGPAAPTYGVALAGSPSVMAAFGAIFTTS